MTIELKLLMKKPSIAHLTMGPVESQEFLAHQIISIETHFPGDADSHKDH